MAFDTSPLSSENVLRDVHDPVSQSLRTTANAVIAPGLSIEIEHTSDSVRLGDGTSFLTSTQNGPKNGLDVNIINTSVPVTIASPINIVIDAADGDNILVVGTEDGLAAGTQHVLRIDSELDLRVGISDGVNKAEVTATNELKVQDTGSQLLLTDISNALTAGVIKVDDDSTQTILTAIETQLTSGTLKVDDDQTQVLLNSVISQLQAGGIIIGTEDGTIAGAQRVFVNNIFTQILAAKDRDQIITYADFGSKDQRVTQIDYVASSIGTGPGFTARKTFTYVLDSNKYKRTNITRLLV